MVYFSQDYIRFFSELEKNNNKEWFDANRSRFESKVRKPFLKFVDDLICQVNKTGANLPIEAKDCLSRINRDIRFSKDKSPYNLNLTAFISPEGKKDKTSPGFFIRITSKNIGIMVGAFSPSRDQLINIRKYLARSNGQFEKIIHTTEFVEHFGEIKGEIQKRIPDEFKDAAQKNFHISLKQFYFVTEIDNQIIMSDRLMEEIIRYYKVSHPLITFLTKAIGRGRDYCFY